MSAFDLGLDIDLETRLEKISKLHDIWTCSLKKASSVDKIRYIAVQFIKIVG